MERGATTVLLFLLANTHFVLQSARHGNELGRRTSASHPHPHGAFRALPPRARADHVVRRGARRGGRSAWHRPASELSVRLRSFVAWHCHRGGRRCISYRTSPSSESTRTVLVTANAPGRSSPASSTDRWLLSRRCFHFTYNCRSVWPFRACPLVVVLWMCAPCCWLFHAERHTTVWLVIYRGRLPFLHAF